MRMAAPASIVSFRALFATSIYMLGKGQCHDGIGTYPLMPLLAQFLSLRCRQCPHLMGRGPETRVNICPNREDQRYSHIRPYPRSVPQTAAPDVEAFGAVNP